MERGSLNRQPTDLTATTLPALLRETQKERRQGYRLEVCTKPLSSESRSRLPDEIKALYYLQCLQSRMPDNHFIPIYIFVVGYSMSILMLLISLGIFMAFSQLRCERITVHKNLFASYVLTGIVWILYYTLVSLDGTVQRENPVWCQVLHVLTQYCTTCNFAWMFCEGLYLHVIMARTFRTGNVLIRVLLFIGDGSDSIGVTMNKTLPMIDSMEVGGGWRGERGRGGKDGGWMEMHAL
ncbi:hypothetical protein ACOMHN_058899 [Nucella lapillus]